MFTFMTMRENVQPTRSCEQSVLQVAASIADLVDGSRLRIRPPDDTLRSWRLELGLSKDAFDAAFWCEDSCYRLAIQGGVLEFTLDDGSEQLLAISTILRSYLKDELGHFVRNLRFGRRSFTLGTRDGGVLTSAGVWQVRDERPVGDFKVVRAPVWMRTKQD